MVQATGSAPPSLRARLGTVLRVLFGTAGAVFVVVAFLRTWDRSEGLPLPAWWRLVLALLAVTAGLLCAYVAWARLLETPPSWQLAAGFYLAQFGKYMPGGVWHVVGQVGYATRSQVSWARAAAAFGVFALVQAVAGGVVGSVSAVAAPGAVAALRWAAAGGLALLLLLDRRWMMVALRLVRRRPGAGARLVPAQRSILAGFGWALVTMVVVGSAFALVLGGIEPGAGAAAVPTFAFAWTVGFLALPFPSGLGVREVVLVALLGAAVGTAAVIAAAVVLRLVTIVAEVALVAASRAYWLRAVSRAGSP